MPNGRPRPALARYLQMLDRQRRLADTLGVQLPQGPSHHEGGRPYPHVSDEELDRRVQALEGDAGNRESDGHDDLTRQTRSEHARP